jgi:diguanylate cyclase (GGDEF)-like protein/PAS domain S-box-containing protein
MVIVNTNTSEMDTPEQTLLEVLPCYVLIQQGGEFVYANRKARLALGSGNTAGLSVAVNKVMTGGYPGLLAEDGTCAAAGHASMPLDHTDGVIQFESILMAKDGRPRNVAGCMQELLFHGTQAHLVLVVERSGGFQEQISGHATFLEELLDSAPEALAIVHKLRILHVNHEFSRLFGYSLEDCIGNNLDELVVPQGRTHESEILLNAVAQNERAYMETVRQTKDGELVDVSVLMAPVRIGGDEVGHFVTYRDIRQQKQVEARLQHSALHDPLTGLANRVLFMDRLELTMTRLVRRPDRNFALLFLDLDHFKQVNDTLGHASGDALLLKVTSRLQACLRPQDTIARFGGDEFAILLDEIASASDAVRVAERIQHAVRQPVDIYGHEVFVSASIGIALGSVDYASAEQLMRDADFAMYRAKANGKARHEIFDNSMHARVTAQKRMTQYLRDGLELDQFEVWYQPVFHLRTGALESMEALMRWKHPERGYLAPNEFMQLAEDTGMILQLGAIVMEKACRQMQLWLAERPGHRIGINVNLSPREFGQPNLLHTVTEVLAMTQLDPGLLRLEITESSVSVDPDAAVIHLQRLSDIGVGVSLDNFGAGMASMNYLMRLPIQLLKLDRRLTAFLPAKGRQGAMIETIFGLGRALQVRMQADGIENEMQLKELKRYGCELGQGMLLAGPLPAADAAVFLDGNCRPVPMS